MCCIFGSGNVNNNKHKGSSRVAHMHARSLSHKHQFPQLIPPRLRLSNRSHFPSISGIRMVAFKPSFEARLPKRFECFTFITTFRWRQVKLGVLRSTDASGRSRKLRVSLQPSKASDQRNGVKARLVKGRVREQGMTRATDVPARLWLTERPFQCQ